MSSGISAAASKDGLGCSFDAAAFSLVAVTEGNGGARIRLSGLLGNSALGICAVTVRTHGGRVNIILRQRLSNGVYSGSFDREFSAPAGVHEVTFGSGNAVIWRREQGRSGYAAVSCR